MFSFLPRLEKRCGAAFLWSRSVMCFCILYLGVAAVPSACLFRRACDPPPPHRSLETLRDYIQKWFGRDAFGAAAFSVKTGKHSISKILYPIVT